MTKKISKLLTEDWIIVFAGAIVLALALIFPSAVPTMPKNILAQGSWIDALYLFAFVLALTYLTSLALKRPMRGIFVSLLCIFLLTLAAQLIASIPVIKALGLETVFFAVLIGLVISNVFGVPEWLKPAIQSEFYIKIGIVALGATILIGDVLQSGAYALVQALVVVFTVWYFAFWIARKYKVDDQMSTMLASSVSICGVSAAIATCGVIKGDNKKLSYIISLVLVIAIPMMYIMPWLANHILPLILNDSEAIAEVSGAWMGGTIDTTGAVVASGALLGETAEKTAVIVKSSQNVLLGVAAFVISLYWSYRGKEGMERPTVGVIWDRFPKFVVGFVAASVIFSIFFNGDGNAAVARSAAKSLSTTFFSIAFVCIGLETRFKEIFSKENRRPLKAFLVAQSFNIVVTFVVALLLFGVLKPALA